MPNGPWFHQSGNCLLAQLSSRFPVQLRAGRAGPFYRPGLHGPANVSELLGDGPEAPREFRVPGCA